MSSYSPRVTTDRLPDYSDLGRFAGFAGWRDLPPADRAVAIFQYLANRETGLFPVQGIYEDPDPGPEYAFCDERDLVKVLTVHGHGYCGLLSPTLDGVFAHAGFEDSRIVLMKENHHCVTEVYYDGGWHYFDLDLRGLLIAGDGAVASLRAACQQRELWTDPPVAVEPFYPLDDKGAMFESFAACRLERGYHWYKNGHTTDLVLRPGESLTRFWEGQDGRWFHPWPSPGGFNLDFLSRRFSEEPRGLKCKHPGWSQWTYGNGLLRYAPRLTNQHQDFDQGAFEHKGVEVTALGIETDDGGCASFAVQSPGIIVGRVVEMGPPSQIQGAAVVYYRSLGPLSLSVSTDDGLTWTRVSSTDHAASDLVDLTPQILHRYGYRLRFDFAGRSGLADLVVHTWTQVSPPSLPRLFAGTNALQFAAGDRYGHRTSIHETRLNLRGSAQLEPHLVRLDGEHDPQSDRARIRGELVLKVGRAGGAPIKWLTLGGYFRTHLREEAARNRNAILYSTAGPDGPWFEVCGSEVPTWVDHWHYGMDGDVVLDGPADEVYVKYIGDPGLNQVWIHAHCLEHSPVSPVRVTHGYEVAGQARESSFVFAEDTDYEICCDGEPENRFIQFSVDSQPTPRPAAR